MVWCGVVWCGAVHLPAVYMTMPCVVCDKDDLADGFCDDACNVAACAFDRGDCDASAGQPSILPLYNVSGTRCMRRHVTCDCPYVNP